MPGKTSGIDSKRLRKRIPIYRNSFVERVLNNCHFLRLSESWPQDNEAAEQTLREELTRLRDLAPHEVRAAIHDLEQEHAPRRTWVWAMLGRSPLAMALSYLTALAKETERSLGGTTLAEINKAYTEWGWKADAAVIDALAAVEQAEDVAAVKAVITALYRPWLEQAATAMQKLVICRSPIEDLSSRASP